MSGGRVNFHTLGCKVNQYETEVLREAFIARGFLEVPDGEAADVYVINTCTVTALADRKSRQFIRRARALSPDAVIAVTGCYAQMNPDDVVAMEEVDIATGTDRKLDIVDMTIAALERREHASTGQTPAASSFKEFSELTEYEDLGVISGMGERTRAFIKIQEGCDRFCSYCIIPFARGSVRSRPEDEIVEEVRRLAMRGYHEIVLTGINTALYGRDNGNTLHGLIGRLEEIPFEFRIRLSSLEPAVIDKEYVKKIIPYSKLCRHLHLSVQSGSDSVLSRMNRPYSRQDYLDIVKVLKDFDPEYGISTDIIAGFPGETEAEFRDSVRLLDEVDFVRIHPFRFSAREGTRASEMPMQTDGKTKAERVEMLMEAGERSSSRFLSRSIGERRHMLTEEVDPSGLVTGYTDNYIKVYIEPQNPGRTSDIELNEFFDIELIELYHDGMLGRIMPEERR